MDSGCRPALCLVLAIMVFTIISAGQVFAAGENDDSAAMEFFSELNKQFMELDQSGSGAVIEEIPGDTGGAPFEEHNSPPPQPAPGQSSAEKAVSHPICPGSVGNLTLDLAYDIRETSGMKFIECSYSETRYVAGYYQTYKLASFGLAWAEDPAVAAGIKAQLCMKDYIGWDEWVDNGKAASVTDVYLHDDLTGLKDEFKTKIKEGLGKAEARAISCNGNSAAGGAQGLTADALWERALEKCNNPNNTKPDFTVDEFLTYLRKVEEANPDANWKQVLTALHADEFAVDLDRRLPIFGVPLFLNGPETDGWEKVNLLCKNPPKFVYDSEGRKYDIDHAYAGPRSDLNRRTGVSSRIITWVARRDIWSDFMRAANTILGDYWQVYFDGPSKFPMDQARGDLAGDWLGRYYEDPANADKPLSEAFREYFEG